MGGGHHLFQKKKEQTPEPWTATTEYITPTEYYEQKRRENEKIDYSGMAYINYMDVVRHPDWYEGSTETTEDGMDIYERAYHKVFKNKDEKLLAEVYKNMLKMDKMRQKEEAEEQKRLRREAEAQRKAELAEQKRIQKEAEAAEKARLAPIIAKEKLRQKALKADRRKKFADKNRHGFYSFIKGFVTFGRMLSGAHQEARNSTETSEYQKNLMEEFEKFDQLNEEMLRDGKMEEFEQKYGSYYRELLNRVIRAEQQVREQNPDLTQDQVEERMRTITFGMKFGDNQASNVVGGTKPNSVQVAQDGSKWLVKESRSCIGVEEPNAAIVTEAGYKVQKLVYPDTAIEAFKGKSAGLGTVSYQRMVQNLVTDHVDLFQFSRTPESMTEEELGKVEALAPQILREHTTDWLLYNFDTKGENFILSRNPDGSMKLYGIDKEAGFRAVLDEGAQRMSKDYQKFDQDTVYNQLFRRFAAGSMDFDLHAVEEQIRRVEAMSDADYMAIFNEYIDQQRIDRPNDVPEIKKRILWRKQNLRAEYREFFASLVRERMQNVSPEEAEALKRKYFRGNAEGLFLFAGDTKEIIQAERQRKAEQKEANHEELERKAKEADAKDEKSYKRRHGFYDFSKGFVMGLKKLKPTGDIAEQRTTQVPVHALKRVATAEEQQAGTATLEMEEDREIFLGGTKPMSEYIASDGSQWLAKQAVNCMGYYKIEGALLTEAGANLQKIVHPATAVDAFVGRTRKHGDVSFQRRLEHVEGGPHKLDLFKFSKHPELADSATIAAVQELSPQILREHTTDWLLCNFDTKGENFIITVEPAAVQTLRELEDGVVMLDENGQEIVEEEVREAREHAARAVQQSRVLHGIDKEAAFNKILKPEAQHMSRTYKPHANNTLYNVVYSMYANAEIDLELFDVLPQIRTIEQMDNAVYMNTFRSYLEHMAQKKPDQIAEIRENILRRKTNLRNEYADFFTQLVNERCIKLHPEEAQALREKYFGVGGDRFRFPA